jgi:hypothetical protein
MKKNLHKLCLVFLLLALQVSNQAFSQQVDQAAQNSNGKYKVGLTTGSFIPDIAVPGDFTANSDITFDGKIFRLIQFYEIPDDIQRNHWEDNGLTLTNYVPGNLYFAVIDHRFPLQTIASKARAIFEVDKRFKQEAPLYFNGIPGHALTAGNKAKLTVSYYAPLPVKLVIDDLKSRGVIIQTNREYSYQIDIEVEASRLEEITALPYIQFIGAQPEEPVNEGTYNHRNSTGRTNYLNTGYSSLNYNGNGVVVAIGEGGTVDGLLDVKGRLTEMETGSPSNHKIGVMQNAGGGGNLDPSNRNNAWGADFLSVSASPDYTSLYSSHDLRYTNHSYGYSIAGGYNSSARDNDLRIASLPNHIVVFSAGNSGAETGYSPYAFATWANITGEVKQNKNMLAIGALNPNDELMGFSSRGPMFDGRIIPQLVTEGIEGTSDAAPKVTGDLAVLAQIYKALNSGTEPPSSLLRAVIMNSADDLDDPGPDYKTGYGMVNMRRAYNIINNSQYLSSSISDGNTNSHTITVPANTKQVRVMIVWPDVAASVNADPAIVNDLDLVGKNPSLVSYNPWVLDHSASISAIDAPATRAVDSRNTIEQVTVDDPASGNWTFEVTGSSVPSGPQTYYLVYEFLEEELLMAFPLKDERFESGETYYLRWDSYGTSGTFDLSYELDASSTWTSIATSYDATKRVYEWVAPTVSGIHSIKFKVERDALSDLSDVNYVGPIAENFRVFKVCNDEVTLKWSPVNGATGYKVYKVGTQYMEELTSNITYNGASAVLTGQSTTESEYYAVSTLTGTFEGQRTHAAEKAPGDYSCLSINWSGDVDTDWFEAGNWSSGVPTSADNAVIPVTANQPQINAAGAVCNNITIESGATLTMNASTAYTLSVSGDFINNGTFTPGIGTVDFNGTNAYQEIGGSSTSNFYILKVTKDDQDNVLEATSLITLNATTDPLDLSSGTFKLSSASTITLFTSSTTLGNTAGLWNNGGTITSNASSLTVNGGLLRNSMGIMNISGYQSIIYMNNGIIRVDGGQLNVGRGIRPNSETSSGTIIISGGAVTLRTSTSTYDVNLDINPSASLTWTDGTVVVQRYASAVAHEIRLEPNTYTISGGTLQIGNASTPVSQTIRINSTVPIYNLVVNATNSPTAQLVTNGLTVLNDVTISGGTLDANDLNLNIGGNWTNNGNFTPGTGTVTFDGFNSQTIGGTADNIFNNLAIDGTDVILATTTALKLTSVSSALTINTGKRLTIPSGQFLTISGTLTNDASTSGLVIESDASGTGSLIHSTADVDATVERYLNNADFGNWKDGWHFLGSPVANQEISPAFTTDPASGYDFYCWFEPDNEWINYKNTTEATTWLIANGSTQFNTGKGYMAAYDVEATKLFTGKLNIGDVGISGLTITGGNQNRSWHLLGNPFSSALSWDATAAWTLINIGGVAKIWNEANQGYSDLTSSPASSIPATNGFMVSVVSGTGSLTIPAAKRSHSSVPFYKSTLPAIMLKAISLSEGNAQESRIAVNPLAQEGFDLMFDSEFLGGYAPVFYSIVNGEKYSTNTIPVIDDKTEIPFVFVKNEGSNFRIEISGTETLETKAFLHDLKTGDIVNIIENPEYSFTSFEGDSPLRFKLTFGDQAPSQEEGIRIFYSQNTLNIFNAEGECLIEVFGMTGQLLLKRQTTDSSIPINLSTGVYMVRVSSQAGVDKVKILVN